jgi:hypothetical protein
MSHSLIAVGVMMERGRRKSIGQKKQKANSLYHYSVFFGMVSTQ